MDAISRGTTPVIDGYLPDDIPIDQVEEMIITFEQSGRVIAQKKYSENEIVVNDQMFTVKLSQEETLKLNVFEEGEIGMRIKTKDENYFVTEYTEKFEVLDGGLTHGKII